MVHQQHSMLKLSGLNLHKKLTEKIPKSQKKKKESCETKLETYNKKKRSIKASLRADLLLVFDENKMKKYIEKYQSREIVRGVDHLNFVKEFSGDRMLDIEALQRRWIPSRGVQHDEYKAEIENVAK